MWDGERQERGAPSTLARVLCVLSHFEKRQDTKCSDDGGTEDHAEIADESASTAEREPRNHVEEKQQ